MYSLDVNFLNDRKERPTESSLRQPVQRSSPIPLILGLLTAIALPALVGGFWLLLQSQNQQLAERQRELDSQLEALNAQLSVIDGINSQIAQIDEENTALATVFDRIKPWSAILQDLTGRVPGGVQITQIEQLGPAEAPPPAPAASPSPGASPEAGEAEAVAPAAPEPLPPRVRIIGVARSFNDVNDFVLTLQRSPFLNPEEVKLVTSQLQDNPTRIEITGERSGDIEVELPEVVLYTIEGGLTDLPTSALLADLNRTTSVGLSTRIEALRDRGVLQP